MAAGLRQIEECVNGQYMYISKFKIRNYKSFVESPPLNLGLGFNVVCGQNSAGKTALLEALAFNTHGHPHRSPQTIPAPGSQPDPISVAIASFALTGQEFSEILRERGAQGYTLIAPNVGSVSA